MARQRGQFLRLIIYPPLLLVSNMLWSEWIFLLRAATYSNDAPDLNFVNKELSIILSEECFIFLIFFFALIYTNLHRLCNSKWSSFLSLDCIHWMLPK